MSEKSLKLDNDALAISNSVEQIRPEDGSSGVTRATLAEQFGISQPSGDLAGDLKKNKRVLLERGISITRAQSEPDMGENIVQFIACTEGVKRDGNRVRNDGWSFDNFAKNPQFLWAHDYSALPIGKHVDWKVDKIDGEPVLRLWSQFCSEDLYPFADKVRKMYEQGFLRAGSIGWIPMKYDTIVDKNGHTVGFDFLENDLLEFSAVPVPSDPNALIEAVQRGVLSGEDMEKLVVNRKSQQDLDVSYRLSNQDDAPVAVSEEEVTIVELENQTDDELIEAAVEERATPEEPVAAIDSEEVNQADSEEVVGEVREEDSVAAAPEGVEENIEAVEERDAEEIIEDEADDRGGMGDDAEGGVKEQLVEVLQEASKDFTTKIVSAVMEVLGDAQDEEGYEKDSVEEDEDGEEERIANAEEATGEAEALIDELVEPEGAYANSAEDEVEVRIGAKVSKENKDRLRLCRDDLRAVVAELDKMVEERKKEEDDDSDLMEVEVPKEDDTTMSAEESIENGVDWSRAVDMAAKIKQDLGMEEEQGANDLSTDDFKTRAQEILKSLGGAPDPADESAEVKSEYLKKLVRRVKSNKDKV